MPQGQRPRSAGNLRRIRHPARLNPYPARTRWLHPGGEPPVHSLQPASRTVAGDPAFEWWSPRDTSAHCTRRQEASLSWVAPLLFPFSRGNYILQLEVNTPQMRKVATEPRFLMAFPHASGPGARQGTSREPPRRLEGPSWGRPGPDASLDGAGSFKRSRGGGGVRLRGAPSGVPVLVCLAVSLAPSHSVSPLPSFPLFFFSFDTKVGL